MRKIPDKTIPYLAAFLLSFLVLAVYGQVVNHAFINFDDQQYVYENRHVLKGLSREGILWSLTSFHLSNWHPLTWVSHMADVEFFGLKAGSHHLVNVLFHLVNSLFLFSLLRRMTGALWRSAFVAALFAVHPLHVESVAWVSERKDVLSTLFFFLAIGAYLRYVRTPNFGRYVLVAACFALGLLCKPMLVTLPFVLLLLDWWPLERFKGEGSSGSISPTNRSRLVLEKVPLLALSVISCLVTYTAQASGGSVSSLERIPPGLRFSNAFVSYVVYLVKTIWPARLAVFYPHPAIFHAGVPVWQLSGSVLLLAAVSCLTLWERNRRPFLTVGWLWYLGTLIPVIGLVQVGEQGFADRYTYIPSIGIYVAIAWGMYDSLRNWRFQRHALWALGVTAVLALSVASWNQTRHWRNSLSLHTHTLRVTNNNWKAWNGLGNAYLDTGQYQKAIDDFGEALRIKPDYPEAWNNLGTVNGLLGKDQQAITYFRIALRVKPDFVDALYNLGTAYGRMGQHRQAAVYFREAIRFRPDYVPAWVNLSIAHLLQGERGMAIELCERLRYIDPASAEELYRQIEVTK